MVVYKLYFCRACVALGPLETDFPLIIDTNTSLVFSLPFVRLQMVARPIQVSKIDSSIELIQFT